MTTKTPGRAAGVGSLPAVATGSMKSADDETAINARSMAMTRRIRMIRMLGQRLAAALQFREIEFALAFGELAVEAFLDAIVRRA